MSEYELINAWYMFVCLLSWNQFLFVFFQLDTKGIYKLFIDIEPLHSKRHFPICKSALALYLKEFKLH